MGSVRSAGPLVTASPRRRKQLIARNGGGLGSGRRSPHGPWCDAEEETALNLISYKYEGGCDASVQTFPARPHPSVMLLLSPRR